MLTIQTAKKTLDACLTTGADFAEIFYEDTVENTITLIRGKVDKSSSSHLYGAGIRILKGQQEVYGYTSDCDEAGLINLANKLAGAFTGEPLGLTFELEETEIIDKHVVIPRESKDVKPAEKITYLRRVDDCVKDYDPRIIQRVANLGDTTQHVTIANTRGVFVRDIRNPQRISLQLVAKDGDKSQSAFGSLGGNFDIDAFKEKDLESMAIKTAKTCLTMLDAPEMVGGVYPVVINNGFGGVLFHEACGHALEASAVARNLSIFSGKLGQKIASDIVTAIDDGTIYNEWGSSNVDDEGHPTQKNVLIKDGVLVGYMVDAKNGARMGMPATGNSRRQNYRYSTTSRMTNTYIANGTSTFDEIISATEYGLFAAELGGGSVNPVTGEFNFAVNEGYMIENGKITHPVRGATLIGNGATALLNIDMVGDNQTFGYGMCGASSGSIPANVGEPTLRIQNMTVGGNGGKE